MNIFHLDLEKGKFEQFLIEEDKVFKFKFNFNFISSTKEWEKKRIDWIRKIPLPSSSDNGKNIFSDVIYEWTMSEWVCAMKEERIFSDGDESWIAFCEIDG